MQHRLSAEDRAFQQEMRDFFTNRIPDEARTWHKDGEVDPEALRIAQRAMHDAGLAVPHWPVEWGGKDWTELQRHIWRTEMQATGTPPPLAFNTNMIGPVIATFGSQEQKERFLPPTASLDIWWCQGFSEPDAGSDLASLRTTAVRDGDEYVVNGQKTWTTLGQFADWIFALVRTDPNAPKKQMGISMLLIKMDSPGVTLRPIKLIDGGHEVNEVFFDNVRVPADQLVGEENKGWDYAKFLLGNERVGVAPVGSIKRKLADAKAFAAQTKTAAGTLLDDPLLAARIAELETELMALEVTVMRVAGSSHDGKPDPASSILKLRGSQLQQDVLELITDIAGPASLQWQPIDGVGEWAAESVPTYLNFRKASIYGGSNEVQRSVISGGILGLKG
ncbi:acyl-CoA dehydrogenase family protein [Yimella sp. cx-51]|uniref:acyl-CoA dehydrogenase family protein n=1 Tax=Yimella sp. cx-51 TaxID=2770551 RepID=UPI00165E0044|nr:acyl-CoA dehydrogenase family protein [Yimella sp. cx-51]MBC9956008.1 acyl-CoA dehydrogenase family protein [Yimella sp. cx-51]QTH37454.1 acyl-CoA dehydrogenase family protein [Yimella sp. cx-51]